MNILLLHNNFPGHFYHIAKKLASAGHTVIFSAPATKGEPIPGVLRTEFHAARSIHPQVHSYIYPTEHAVLQGQAAYRMALGLKEKGFIPDIIYGHSGWGATMYMKDVFPNTPLVCYFEFFYNAHRSHFDFNPGRVLSVNEEARIRTGNVPFLIDLYSCDQGVSPTNWQRSQFPAEYHHKIAVMHDGVDTDFFQPCEGAKLVLPHHGLDLSQIDEIITYVTRAMEPRRGFPQFMEALSLLQKRRPNCHAVIVGNDRTEYDSDLSEGKTYKELALESNVLDLSRVHFIDWLAREDYLKVLQASTVHVYLTKPFVLSWSIMEAMSAGCAVVASDTDPVKEVMSDGVNGLLADFFQPQDIANCIEEVLVNSEVRQGMRKRSREMMLERYSLNKLLPKHLALLYHTAGKKVGGMTFDK